MNDPENFLSRWSRRKRDASEQREKAEHHETSALPTGDAGPTSGEVTLCAFSTDVRLAPKATDCCAHAK